MGCIVPESIYSHKPLSFLPFAVVCLQCPQPVPCQLSVFKGKGGQKMFPPKNRVISGPSARLNMPYAPVLEFCLLLSL